MTKKSLIIERRYLCFPAAFSGREATLALSCAQTLIKTINLWISPEYTKAGDRPGFIGWIDLADYIGETIDLQGNMPEQWFDHLYQSQSKPDVTDRGERPQAHYTARQGWINDPNGLILYDSIYHLFYQYNPYSKSWGNMHWGHATSQDLVHWTEHDPAIYPNGHGVAFSGCAVIDRENTSGLGKDAMILFYTAFQEKNKDPLQSISTIRRYYSNDSGQTFHFDPDFFISQIVPGNRDPKIFYHQETQAWIMVLFLENNEFAILRSDNLNEWNLSQQFSLDDTWECPDLFCLVNPETKAPHWLFWTGDGFYYIGDFDGYVFTNVSGRKRSSETQLSYAAQTFFNTADRVISISWLRTANYYSPYTGMMSLPKELSLRQTDRGLVLIQHYAREICDRLVNTVTRMHTDQFECVHVGGTFQLKFEIDRSIAPSDPDRAVIDILEKRLVLDFRFLTATIGNTVFMLPDKKQLDFDIFVDYGVIEILLDGGTVSAMTEYYFSSLTGNIRLATGQGNQFRYIEINDFTEYVNKAREEEDWT